MIGTQAELLERVKLHWAWLHDESGGVRFVCKWREDFSGADLSGAVLSDAVLRRAVLSGADLSDAVLRRADLSGAVLSDAVLRRADLSGADLSDADLGGADLGGAVLKKTCIDSANTKLARTIHLAFQAGRRGGMIAYRTLVSSHIGDTEYTPGKTFVASALSWSVETDCHPGIYFASLDWLRNEYSGPFVRVYIRAGDWVPTPGKGGLVGRAARVRVLGVVE